MQYPCHQLPIRGGTLFVISLDETKCRGADSHPYRAHFPFSVDFPPVPIPTSAHMFTHAQRFAKNRIPRMDVQSKDDARGLLLDGRRRRVPLHMQRRHQIRGQPQGPEGGGRGGGQGPWCRLVGRWWCIFLRGGGGRLYMASQNLKAGGGRKYNFFSNKYTHGFVPLLMPDKTRRYRGFVPPGCKNSKICRRISPLPLENTQCWFCPLHR